MAGDKKRVGEGEYEIAAKRFKQAVKVFFWMSHVSQEWVMSHKNESCLTRMSHVSQEWVMSHKNESCLLWLDTQYDLTFLSLSLKSSNRSRAIQASFQGFFLEWVMSHRNESYLKWLDIQYDLRIISHVLTSCNVTRAIQASCKGFFFWMSHVSQE